ncbi:hypothetical protein ACFCVY_35505, partial [Streptomyces sp. NPDC056411]
PGDGPAPRRYARLPRPPPFAPARTPSPRFTPYAPASPPVTPYRFFPPPLPPPGRQQPCTAGNFPTALWRLR